MFPGAAPLSFRLPTGALFSIPPPYGRRPAAGPVVGHLGQTGRLGLAQKGSTSAEREGGPPALARRAIEANSQGAGTSHPIPARCRPAGALLMVSLGCHKVSSQRNTWAGPCIRRGFGGTLQSTTRIN